MKILVISCMILCNLFKCIIGECDYNTLEKIFKDERLPLIIIDFNFLSQDQSENDLIQLIHKSSSTFLHLATLGVYLTHIKQENIFNGLKNCDLKVTKSLDQWSIQRVDVVNRIDMKINDNVTIKISILYERLSAYWWYYPIGDDNALENTYIRTLTKQQLKPKLIGKLKFYFPVDLNATLKELNDNYLISCNYTRSLDFYKRYPQDTSVKAKNFKNKAYKLLKKANKALTELQIPFWLSSGTCLGFYRQCDIIDYSKDVDIGVFIDDYRPKLIPKFVAEGLHLIHVFGQENDSFELSFEYLKVKLDIFFFYKEDFYYWNGGVQARTGQKYKYTFPKFELCWTEFLELKVRIPCPTLPYIEANYGKNWHIPTSEWDWKSSPPNVKPNGIWPRSQWSEVIQDNKHECLIK